jgi:hypothetical protein
MGGSTDFRVSREEVEKKKKASRVRQYSSRRRKTYQLGELVGSHGHSH